MIGFELNINGERISAGLEKGVVSIILTKVVTTIGDEFIDSIDLDFTGLDTSGKGKEESIDWYKTQLKVGDELTIKVGDIMTNSTPLEIREKNLVSKNGRTLKS